MPDLLRTLAGEQERGPGSTAAPAHHLTAADAQASPPPSAVNKQVSPSRIFSCSMASSSAVGTDADDVLP